MQHTHDDTKQREPLKAMFKHGEFLGEESWQNVLQEEAHTSKRIHKGHSRHLNPHVAFEKLEFHSYWPVLMDLVPRPGRKTEGESTKLSSYPLVNFRLFRGRYNLSLGDMGLTSHCPWI